MDIIIKNHDGRPIYEQITSQIKKQIMQNTLKEGDSLPSMRLLAKELCISVITTKRAYAELERQGFIVTITGKGSYVAKQDKKVIVEEKKRQIEQYFKKAIEIAGEANLDLDRLLEILKNLYEGE